MTNIVASKPFFTSAFDLLDFTAGAVTVATATAYRVTRGTSYDELTGTFTYDSDGRLVGGTITGWKQVTNGGVAFTALALPLSVDDFLSYLAANDTAGFLGAVFGGDDKITGSNFGDVVDGQGGNDSVSGRGGDDELAGADDSDTLDGGSNDDVLLGGTGNDSLIGGAGGDVLDGGVGTDSMAGGAGDDVYFIVADLGDMIVETAGQGTDSIVTDLASFSLTALQNVEDLILIAPGSAGTGNALNNRIMGLSGNHTLVGGSGNDTLDGGDGADSLSGGKGDDTYVVDDSSDVVTENPGDGKDTIQSALLAIILADPGLANVENLTLLDGALNGVGNDLANVITGNDEANDIGGLGGNDTLTGGAGKDALSGNTGDNLLIGGDDDDFYIVASAGDKVIERTGEASGHDLVIASVSYTLAANVEDLELTGAAVAGIGNAANNNLTGNDIDNKLAGLAGTDFLAGALGNDLLDGGAGSDDLKGGDGVDTLLGGAGDDFLDGNLGADSMAGGAGNDFYTVDGTGDLVSELPGQGIDTVVSRSAQALADNVESLILLPGGEFGAGNALNNRMTGSTDDDTLLGGLGNDTLDGAAGADSLVGGKGDDVYIFATPDFLGDAAKENPGEGKDTVHSHVSTALGANLENLVLLGGATVGQGNELANVITGNDENNLLLGGGGPGKDTLIGGAGADTLQGGPETGTLMIGGTGSDFYIVQNAGDRIVEATGEDSDIDTVIADMLPGVGYTLAANVENLEVFDSNSGTGNGSNNEITGGTGNNKLLGLAGNDFLAGDAGNDTLDGGAHQDDLQGNAGDDSLQGGAGDDALTGNAGDDTLAGGAGDDSYFVDDVGDKIIELAGQGFDSIITKMAGFSLDTEALKNIEGLFVQGTGTGNALNNRITGREGNDTLIGGLGDDTLNGFTGADSLIGGKGNDVYVIDDLGDRASEVLGEGTDTVRTSLSSTDLSDAVFANIENLTLIGGALNGQGNDLANVIAGNDNNNILSGLGGTDTLIGGKGNDTYRADGAADKVVELAGVDSGFDVVNASVDYVLSANVERLNLLAGAINGAGNAQDNFIVGNAAANKLSGLEGNDNLFGSDGSDTLDGGLGNDTLFGGFGDDQLLGGAGNDLLNNDAGKDTLAGGAGNDIYSVDDDLDTIVEAAGQGIDKVLATINYKLGSNLENLSLDGGATLGQGNELNNLVVDVGLATTNNTLEGFAGNDTLDGGAGSDTLIGGKGDDTYVIDNAGDTVTENAAEGKDTILSRLASIEIDGTFGNVENLVLLDGALGGTGNGLANVITGNDGGNSLDGAAGNDTMIGGDGNDTYTVLETGDKVVELAGADSGFDEVNSFVDYTLSANVERLALSGAAVSGTGNAQQNFITGNDAANRLFGLAGGDGLHGGAGDDTVDGGAGNDAMSGGNGNDSLLGGADGDVLDGGAGSDSMAGGTGDDRYVVDGTGDQVIELAGQGIDSVVVQAGSYALGANVESASLFNNAGATGNALANLIAGDTFFSGNNVMSGGGGNDTLVGGTGTDVMTGGDGRDRFVVSIIDGAVESVTDFDAGPLGDALDLSDLLLGFVAGSSNPGDFVQFATAAGDTTVRVDVDGAANGANFVDVCLLQGVTLDNVNQAAMEGNLVLA